MKKAEIKRAQIADDDKDGWCMIDEAEENRIHSPEYLDKVEEWIKNNEKVKISPRMKDTLIKRDRKGRKVLHEDTLQPIRVQRRILLVCPRELHNFMIKDFPFAMEGDKVLVTENKIRKLLKTSCSHVKKFTLRDKRMCGCHACTIFEDIFTCKCAWTKKFIQQSKDEIKNKMSGTEKRKKQHDLTAYVSKVCLDKEGTKLKNVDAWDAACELGCEPIKIRDKYYEPFTCALGQCNDCNEN